MVNYKLPLFQHKPEVWDAKTCARKAKHVAKDGMGTPYPFKGYLGSGTSCPPKFGEIRYNGGCVRKDDKGNEEWYQGENRPFPIIDPAYEIVKYATWGWVIKKK